MRINDDVGLLEGYVDHEEARWGKGVVATSWGGEFLRRATPQTNDGSEGRRQRLWKMAITQWRIIGIAPFKKQRGMEVLKSSAWFWKLGI
jgi:hypothetical protein